MTQNRQDIAVAYRDAHTNEGVCDHKNIKTLERALSENQVIYHRGGRRGTQSFETVFTPLRDSAYSAVESKGMASSLEKSTVPLERLHEVIA